MRTRGVPVKPLARAVLGKWARDPQWPDLVAEIEKAIAEMTTVGRLMKTGEAQADMWRAPSARRQRMAHVEHGGWHIEAWARAGKAPSLDACLESDEVYLDESTLVLEKIMPTAAHMAIYQERADRDDLRVADIVDIEHVGAHLVVKACFPEKSGKFTIQHRPERHGKAWWDRIGI